MKMLALISYPSVLAVTLNGETINLSASNNYEETFQTADVLVVIHKYRELMGQTIHLTTSLYTILIYATPHQWDEEYQEVTR